NLVNGWIIVRADEAVCVVDEDDRSSGRRAENLVELGNDRRNDVAARGAAARPMRVQPEQGPPPLSFAQDASHLRRAIAVEDLHLRMAREARRRFLVKDIA